MQEDPKRTAGRSAIGSKQERARAERIAQGHARGQSGGPTSKQVIQLPFQDGFQAALETRLEFRSRARRL